MSHKPLTFGRYQVYILYEHTKPDKSHIDSHEVYEQYTKACLVLESAYIASNSLYSIITFCTNYNTTCSH